MKSALTARSAAPSSRRRRASGSPRAPWRCTGARADAHLDQRIAEHAGVRRSTVYRHFPDEMRCSWPAARTGALQPAAGSRGAGRRSTIHRRLRTALARAARAGHPGQQLARSRPPARRARRRARAATAAGRSGRPGSGGGGCRARPRRRAAPRRAVDGHVAPVLDRQADVVVAAERVDEDGHGSRVPSWGLGLEAANRSAGSRVT